MRGAHGSYARGQAQGIGRMEWWMIVSVVLVAAVIYGYRSHTRESRNLLAVLTPVSERHGGTVKRGSLFVLPELRFADDHGSYLVTAMPNAGAQAFGQGPFSLVDLELTFDSGQSLSVARTVRSAEGQVNKLIDTVVGRERLSEDESDFVSSFRILAGDFVLARKLLDAPTRDVLLNSRLPELDLRVERSKITVYSDGYPRDATVPEEMISIAKMIAERCASLRESP